VELGNACPPPTAAAGWVSATASNNAFTGCPTSRARAWDNAEALGTAAPGASAGTTRASTESYPSPPYRHNPSTAATVTSPGQHPPARVDMTFPSQRGPDRLHLRHHLPDPIPQPGSNPTSGPANTASRNSPGPAPSPEPDPHRTSADMGKTATTKSLDLDVAGPQQPASYQELEHVDRSAERAARIMT